MENTFSGAFLNLLLEYEKGMDGGIDVVVGIYTCDVRSARSFLAAVKRALGSRRSWLQNKALESYDVEGKTS